MLQIASEGEDTNGTDPYVQGICKYTNLTVENTYMLYEILCAHITHYHVTSPYINRSRDMGVFYTALFFNLLLPWCRGDMKPTF